MAEPTTSPDGLIQLHLVHPYSIEIRDHSRVKRYLEGGFRIRNLQRVSDREVLVTLAPAPQPGT